MSDKIEKYNEIASEVAKLSPDLFFGNANKEVEQEAASLIRELRKFIERLRRIVEDGKKEAK